MKILRNVDWNKTQVYFNVRLLFSVIDRIFFKISETN